MLTPLTGEVPVLTSFGRPRDYNSIDGNRKREANLFDPDGTSIELMQPMTIDGTSTPS